MDHYDLHPDYDPNLLPQWQRPSQLEEKFVRLVQRLYTQETNSLLCGSEYAGANDKLLRKKRQRFFKGANPFMLRYKFPYEPEKEDIDSFLKMKKGLTDSLESTHPEQAVSLSWDIDYLAQNPYKALLSWQCAFDKYWESKNNPSALLQWETYYAFHCSTLYLLCLFIPHTHHDAAFNPLQIVPPLQEAFAAEMRAFFTMQDVYPPVNLFPQKMDMDTKDVTIYDYLIWTKSVWHAPADFLERLEKPLYHIFEKHIIRNSLTFDAKFFEEATKYILELGVQNGKIYYLFPFICTKIFAEQFFDDPPKDMCMIEETLYGYETILRLFNRHHRKIQSDDIYNSDERTHPVIAFMLDVVSLCYEFEMIDLNILRGKGADYIKSEHKRMEYEVMDQINTNWLILYLYGNGRLFNDPCICSHFCELKLPVLLRALFLDEEGDLQLDGSWLLFLARINDRPDLSPKVMDRLREECAQEIEKMSELAPAWKEQLAEYIFDPSLWEDTSLKASSSEFQTQIDGVNLLINKVDTLWTKRHTDSDPPSMIIRGICIAHLFSPILDILESYLETSASLETHWELFSQLGEYIFEITRNIDQEGPDPTSTKENT